MAIALTPAQEGHGLLEWFQRRSRGPEEGHRAGDPLLRRKKKGAELIQPEGKALGRLYRRLPVLTEGLQEWWGGGGEEEPFIRECTNKTRSDAFKLK